MSDPQLQESDMDPDVKLHRELNVKVKAVAEAARAVLRQATWTCSDGHRHPRPDVFTRRRLQEEVRKRPEADEWTSSIVSLGVWELMDSGELFVNHDLTMRKGARFR